MCNKRIRWKFSLLQGTNNIFKVVQSYISTALLLHGFRDGKMQGPLWTNPPGYTFLRETYKFATQIGYYHNIISWPYPMIVGFNFQNLRSQFMTQDSRR